MATGGYALWQRQTADPWPARWDARILPLVRYVERARALQFKHPVQVDYLTESAFTKLVTRPSGTSSSRQKEEERRTVGLLRALGLAQGDLDLGAAGDTLTSQTIVAFYDVDDTRHIIVRGTNVDVAMRVTLVHELTHALQDQWFDLNEMRDYARTRNQTDAVRALYEGDASWVADEYVAALSTKDRAAYVKSRNDFTGKADLQTVPDALVIQESWPYDIGPAFVTVLRGRSKSVAALDEAFRTPPRAEQLVLDPAAFLRKVRPVKVTEAALPRGAANVDRQGEFGALGWYTMLSERVEAHAALRAIDGWAGDAITSYDLAGKRCATITWAGTDGAATQRLSALLAQWRSSVAATGASVSVDGVRLVLQTCDPGPAAKVVTRKARDAYNLLALRSVLIGAIVKQGGTVDVATCAARRIVDATPVSEVSSSANGAFFETERYAALTRASVQACLAA